MNDIISGCWVATATPLTASGGVDHQMLADHGNWLFGQGCDGLVLFGTTGEGTSFSAKERLDTMEALLKAGIPASKLAMGTGFPAITDSISLSRDSLAMGLPHVLILPPYFYRDAPADGVADAFSAIIDGVNDPRLRVTLYHIPQVSGVGVAPASVAALRARYGVQIAGVKDSSGDFAHFEAFREAAPDVAVLIGNEAEIAHALQLGGVGTICGLGNLVPDMVRAMFTDPSAAGPMRDVIALMQGPFTPTVKAILAAQTGNAAWARTRAPLRPVAAEHGARIATALDALRQKRAA